MTTVIDILEELEANGSRLVKEDILDSHRSNELLQTTFVAVMNPYIDFGVRKFRKPKPAPDQRFSDDVVVEQFLELLLGELADRSLSGNAAKGAVSQEFESMTKVQQKWCERILLRNLRVGVQEKTVNKTWPDLIPKFSVLLANSLKTSHDHFSGAVVIDEGVKYPVLIEPKIDGLRLIAIKKGGIVTFHTRNGNTLETLPIVRAALEACDLDNFVLDGEAAGKDWNESASVLMSSKRHKDDSSIVYNVFDGMSLDNWVDQLCQEPITQRRKKIQQIVEAINSPNVELVEQNEATNENELMRLYEKALDNGFEGIMLKDPGGRYTFNRTKAMLKMKPVATYEGVIVGWYGGRHNTRHQHSFGGFEIVLPNGVVTRVGGGFSDKDRALYMVDDPSTYVGRIVEAEGQPPLTVDGRIRFPVFKRFRDRRDVDPKLLEAADAFIENENNKENT